MKSCSIAKKVWFNPSAHDLKQMAGELNGIVSRFKIEQPNLYT